jgi:hypothetical protein
LQLFDVYPRPRANFAGKCFGIGEPFKSKIRSWSRINIKKLQAVSIFEAVQSMDADGLLIFAFAPF